MRKSNKKDDVAFKLDLEKAFDKVNWDFLKDCLNDFDLSSSIIKLIMHCATSSYFFSGFHLSKSRDFYSTGVPRTKINCLTAISKSWAPLFLITILVFLSLNVKQLKVILTLSLWICKLDCLLGRLDLATSIMSFIPSYYMHVTWLLQNICNIIDKPNLYSVIIEGACCANVTSTRLG